MQLILISISWMKSTVPQRRTPKQEPVSLVILCSWNSVLRESLIFSYKQESVGPTVLIICPWARRTEDNSADKCGRGLPESCRRWCWPQWPVMCYVSSLLLLLTAAWFQLHHEGWLHRKLRMCWSVWVCWRVSANAMAQGLLWLLVF